MIRSVELGGGLASLHVVERIEEAANTGRHRLRHRKDRIHRRRWPTPPHRDSPHRGLVNDNAPRAANTGTNDTRLDSPTAPSRHGGFVRQPTAKSSTLEAGSGPFRQVQAGSRARSCGSCWSRLVVIGA
jgi:hypothetical protein